MQSDILMLHLQTLKLFCLLYCCTVTILILIIPQSPDGSLLKYTAASSLKYTYHWRIQGGRRRHVPPNRINFFRFHICFSGKVYTLEVGAPPTGRCPPNGKSWIHHCIPFRCSPSRNFYIIVLCTYLHNTIVWRLQTGRLQWQIQDFPLGGC